MARGIGRRPMNPSRISASESVNHQRSWSIRLIDLQHYGLAVLSVAIALAASLLLQHFHFRVPAALLLLFAVAVSSWYAGLGPAVLAAILSIISFYWYFVEPVRTIYIYPSQIPYFITFAAFAVLLSWFGKVRGRAEKDLREQAALLNLTHDTVFVMDLGGVIKYWNRGAEQRYGWAADQAVGRVVHDLLKTVFPEPFEKIKAELTRTGRWEGELVHTKKDGTPLIVASRWSLQRDERNAPLAILETNNDITKRKRAEEKIRQQDMELRQVLDFAPQQVAVFGPDRERLYANRPALEYLGLTLQEWRDISDPLYFFHPDDRERMAQEVFAGGSSDLPHEFEARFGKKGGPHRWFLFRDTPFRDEQGQITRWYLSATDIEDRKRAEEALRRSEAYLAEAQRLTHTGSWASDGKTREVLYWSEEMCRIFDFDPQKGLPTRDQAFHRIHPEDRAKVAEHSERTFREKVDYELDYRILLPDGTVKHLHTLGHPVLGPEGDIIEVVGTNVDITQRKQTEEELRRLNRELRALSNCNQTLLRATDENSLLKEICRIVCEEAGYRMAWVAYAENDEAKGVRPVTWTGVEEGYLATIGITWADTERGRGPTGTAIRSGNPCCIEDFATDPRLAPWREGVLQRGFRSGIGLPLKDEHGHAFGSLTIYSAQPNAFTSQEIRLLEELAGDLAFGIVTLRSRAARKQAEQEVAMLSFALDNVRECAFLTEKGGRFRYVNEEGCRILGYTRAELLGMSVPDIDPEFPAERWSAHWRELKARRTLNFETVHRTRDGRVFPVEISANYFEYGGLAYNLALARDITDRKRAEEALRRSEAYLAESQKLTHTGSWALDVVTREYDYWSKEMFRIFGIDPQKGIPSTETVARRVYREDRDRVMTSLEKSLREKVDTSDEYRFVAPGGTIKHIQAIRHPVLNDAGDLVKLVGTFIDITERKRAEEALWLSNAYNRSLIEASVDPLVTIGPDGKITDVNAATESATGRSRSELIGTDFCDYFTEPPKARAGYELVFRKGMVRDYPLELRHRDGRVMSVLYNASVYRDESGQIIGVFAAARDITERKRAEQALRRSEAYLADAQRLTHSGSWAWDPRRDEMHHCSEETFRIYGFDPQEGVPTIEKFMQRVHPDDRDRLRESSLTEALGKKDHVLDYRIVLPDGALKYVHSIRHPILDGAGEVVEVVGTVVDVTQRKRAEEERRAQVWFLESMDRINRAIQGTKDLELMMSEVLDAVRSIFGCDRAWLVYPCDAESPSWHTVMERTRLEFPGAFAVHDDFPMQPEVAEVHRLVNAASGNAVRFGAGADKPVPSGLAQRFSVQSQMLMAIYPKVDKPYLFGMDQCTHARVWTQEEEALFKTIGGRLTDMLTGVLMFQKLQESRARLEEAQRIAHVGYWRHDLEPDGVTWSDETYRIFGLQPQERAINFADIQELIHPEDRTMVTRAREQAWSGGPRYSVEYRLIRPSGEMRIVHSQGNVMRDESGHPRRMFGTVQDITERKRAEESLRDSETRFRAFVDHTADAFFVLDFEQGTIIDCNQCACESLGFTRAELIGKTPLAFDVNLDRTTLETMSERTVAGETVLFDRHWHRRKDGSTFPVEVHTSVFQHGGRRFLLKVARDISDRFRAEEQRERLRELEADFARINRVSVLGELTASIAHEVNQPLSGVMSNGSACLRWLAGDTPNVEEAREAARRIVRDGKRAGEVIARIRALTKRAVTTRERLDLNETIREVLALVGDEAKRNSVIIRTYLADGVFSVLGDRVQLQQVVLNLLMNAIEAMSSVDERARELVITTQNMDSEQVQVTVEDSGLGLDPDTAGKIFDPFYTTKSGGMGMGLSISRSILDAHGGRLWVAAKDGPGTMFHFTVPKYHEEDTHAAV